MKFSISTCSFYKFRIRKLLQLPKGFGVEIFYEFGSEDQWESLLSQLAARGLSGFSIHAPFAFVDIAEPCDEKKLFEALKRPFDLYHRYQGEFYVLHTYGEAACPEQEPERQEYRARAAERLSKFNEICKAEEVLLAAENLCSGKIPLFNETQLLDIFRQIPDLHCVVDVGHALVSGMCIERLQRELNHRICAYHLHNNDGIHDSHERLREGVMDWQSFAKNCTQYTPDAAGVLEYMVPTDISVFQEDAAYLEKLINAST